MVMITLTVFEDNPHFQASLKHLFSFIPDIDLVSCNNNCDTLEETILHFKPDVILMDIDMPGMNGIDATYIVKEISPDTQVIMLTVSEDENRIFKALSNGATGYLVKKSSYEEIIDAVRSVHLGGSPMTPAVARKVMQFFSNSNQILAPITPENQNKTTLLKPKTIENEHTTNLTPREYEILEGLVDGFSYKMIGGKLFISTETVKNHIQKIYRKLQVNSKGEAIGYALKNKLIN
jgi:DNA-binding NarL/FixJ family response regulator